MIITLLTMVVMEVNVLCNPFSPIQWIHWAQSPDHREADSGPRVGRADPVADDPGELAGSSTSRGERGEHDCARPRLGLPPELDEVVALTLKKRWSTGTRLLKQWSLANSHFCIDSHQVPASIAASPREGQAHHFHVPGRLSLLPLLCRFRC